LAENNKELTVVDFRGHAERVNGYIPNSIIQPLDTLENDLKNKTHSIPLNKTIYTICRSGARGNTGLAYLKKFGFNDLVNIDGGILAIQKANFELAFAKCSKSGI
jgi:phage shock protein E